MLVGITMATSKKPRQIPGRPLPLINLLNRDRHPRRVQPDRSRRQYPRIDRLAITPPPVINKMRPFGPKNEIVLYRRYLKIRHHLAGQVALPSARRQHLHHNDRVRNRDPVARQRIATPQRGIRFKIVVIDLHGRPIAVNMAGQTGSRDSPAQREPNQRLAVHMAQPLRRPRHHVHPLHLPPG